VIKLTDNHAPRLFKASPRQVIPAIGDELHESAEIIANDARISIIDGGISGSGHIPSIAGQPPNADTHDLDQSIHATETIEVDGYVKASVVADSDHALYMELGTTKIEERPFMRPAVARHRRTTVKSIALAYNRQVR
jgi:hypothetical protein